MKKVFFLMLGLIITSMVHTARAQDTIYNVPFAYNIDLFINDAYLINRTVFRWDDVASWEMVWVDDTVRASVKNGDILRVTFKADSIKDYVLKVNEYLAGSNALLSSIAWPDIPLEIYSKFGWNSETLPGFNPEQFYYELRIPADQDSLPVLICTPQDLNAEVHITGAKRLNGSVSDRTITIHVSSENNEVENTYSLVLNKVLPDESLQAVGSEPFLSQLVFRQGYQNTFWEICNPSNEPLDLSNYMFYFGPISDPDEAIRSSSDKSLESWNTRYTKYIPGLKWDSYQYWDVYPAYTVIDPYTDPFIQPFDVFVYAFIGGEEPRWAIDECDIDFAHNPFNDFEEIDQAYNLANGWLTFNFFMFKIVNDDVKNGLKTANDPADFELIETWGTEDQSEWVVGGVTAEQVTSYTRKSECYLPKAGYKESWGTNEGNSEWIRTSEKDLQDAGVPWPDWRLNVAKGIGEHDLNSNTLKQSIVFSEIYLVSTGTTEDEIIQGLTEGITLNEFYNRIIKADSSQSLSVFSTVSGDTLLSDDIVQLGDSLIVFSADLSNKTKYYLDFMPLNLSSDVILTSEELLIEAVSDTGSVSGFAYGSILADVLNKVSIPLGATLNIIDTAGFSISLKVINYAGAFIDRKVTDDLFFEVISEDQTELKLYKLIPGQATDPFGFDPGIFKINETDPALYEIPSGLAVSGLMAIITVAEGVEAVIVDKLGWERKLGTLAFDDRLLLISADDNDSIYYYLNFDQEETYEQAMVVDADAGPDIMVDIGNEITLFLESPYSVVWNNGVVNGVPFIPLETQDYIVTVFNDFFSDSDTVKVVVNKTPSVDAGPDISICFGESCLLQLSSSYDVSWNQGVLNGVSFIPQSTKDYIVTISNTYFSNTDTLRVVVKETPEANAGSDQELCGEEALLSGNEVEGAQYSWSNIDNLAELQSPTQSNTNVSGLTLGANSFSYKVTLNECTSIDTLTLDILDLTGITIDAEYTDFVCRGASNGNISVSASGGVTPYTWDWSTGESDDTLKNLQAGSYQLTVTDHRNCKAYRELTIQQADPYEGQEICQVSANKNNKNIVAWEPVHDGGTAFYNVYREGDYVGEYSLLGSVPIGEGLGIYEDLSADPGKRSYQYKISSVDTCGNESAYSGYHKTILLSIGIGIDAFNLYWNNYEVENGGISFLKFYIMRGETLDQMEIIDSISANNNAYIDNNPPDGQVYYQIAGIVEGGCNVSSYLKSTPQRNTIYSNIEDNGKVGVLDKKENAIHIYPNPITDHTKIRISDSDCKGEMIRVLSLSGKVCFEFEIEDPREIILEKGNLLPGVYFLETRGKELYRAKFIVR